MTGSWYVVITTAVGGLTDAGFAEASEAVLVIGHQGRGVFDTNTGELLARDDDNTWAWLDPTAGTAKGIGPLHDQDVRMAGLMSGQTMAITTHDRWLASATRAGVSITGPRGASFDVRDDEELRTFGFSPTGQVLVVATSPSLTIVRRR